MQAETLSWFSRRALKIWRVRGLTNVFRAGMCKSVSFHKNDLSKYLLLTPNYRNDLANFCITKTCYTSLECLKPLDSKYAIFKIIEMSFWKGSSKLG